MLNIVERDRARGRHRPVRRPDAAQPRARACSRPARRSSAPRSSRSTSPRTASCFTALLKQARPAPARERHRDATPREAVAVARRIGYPVLVRPELRARRPRDGDRLRRRRARPLHDERRARPRPTGRSSSTSSSRTRSRSTSTRSRDGQHGRDRRRHGAHRGGRHPLRRLDLRAAAAHARPARSIDEIRAARRKALARALDVVGLMNVQFAVKGDARLRARGQPARLAHGARSSARRSACRCAKLAAQGDGRQDARGARLHRGGHAAATSRSRSRSSRSTSSPASTSMLGPEMRSTGEVMGIDDDLGRAFAKAYRGRRPEAARSAARVFISVKNADKRAIVAEARALAAPRLRAARDRRHLARAQVERHRRSSASTRSTRAARTSST